MKSKSKGGFKRFLWKWTFIFTALIGGSAYFVYSDHLNDVEMVKSGKDSAKEFVHNFYETKKNEAIESTLNKIGYNGNKPAVIAPSASSPLSTTPDKVVEHKPSNDKNESKDKPLNPLVEKSEFPPLKLSFYYDSSRQPSYLKEEEIMALFQRASDAWTQACNISFEFKGKRATDYVDVDNVLTGKVGLIKWGPLGGNAIGQAHQGSARGPVYNFVLTLKDSFFASEANKGFLYTTTLHEMGHVIGLDHSKNSDSIMFFQQLNRKQVLNENDKKMCQYFRGRWSGMNAEQASDKYGVLFNKSLSNNSPEEEE